MTPFGTSWEPKTFGQKMCCHVFGYVFHACLHFMTYRRIAEQKKQGYHWDFFFFLIFFLILCTFFCFCFTLPFMGFDTSSIVSKHPRDPTVTKKNTIAQFHCHKRGRGRLTEGDERVPRARRCLKKLQRPQNTEKRLSVCSRVRTYISLIYH